ncbi:LysR family transcriptional regulator [Sulfidibacter corallicola]|uniref:LysR family transcriptional regulator n=1 Tax=Sulfidibacter corallicola TaxID=2818388 RepID=A0A8A4TKJ8_SULCO|nr:LysR family transcriptional regulator [Sulfidibacter corallicola]QTD49358.1 LysR family transcriptional regulator [Sulfidibacter corallicola]
MFQWDDLRYFLTVARSKSIAEAARKLRVNQSTVSRRLAALESDLDVRLCTRDTRGLSLTSAGEHLLGLAEEMERTALSITRTLEGANTEAAGTVVVATIEEIATWYIAPLLPEFYRDFPKIRIDLRSSPYLVNLSRGEADVAIRLVRPHQSDLVARKLGGFGYGVYVSEAYHAKLTEEQKTDPYAVEWIVPDLMFPNLPESNWFHERHPNLEAILRCNGFKPLIAAVKAGLGAGLLPRPTARHIKHLVRLPIDTGDIYREVWLVAHQERRKSAAVQAVMNFLAESTSRPLISEDEEA